MILIPHSMPLLAGILALIPCTSSALCATFPSQAQATVTFRGPDLLEDELAHEKIALRWFSEYGVDPEIEDPLELLTGGFIEVELGLFKAYFPPRSEGAERVPRAIETLLDVQEVWATWCLSGTGERELPKDVAKAHKTLAKWIGGLKPKTLQALPAGAHLFADGGASESVLAARMLWSNWIAKSTSARGIWPAEGRAILVLQPTRKEFVEFSCVLGHALPDLREVYWGSTVPTWSELDFQSIRVSPLSYSSNEGKGYEAEYSMDIKNRRGIEQHIAQIATRSMLDVAFTTNLDAFIAGGLANLLLIDVFGEADTMVDGDRRSSATKGSSRFIPSSEGGQSFGGMLPAVSAESRWREGKGKDHFVKVLRKAQKAGKKKAPSKADRERTFILLGDSKKEKLPFVAPLLHPSAGDKALAPGFFGDYAEMARAYRVAFLFWLREESDKTSNSQFSNLLAALAAEREVEYAIDAVVTEPFHTAVEKTYDMPLSNAQTSDEDLEGRFLSWLAK